MKSFKMLRLVNFALSHGMEIEIEGTDGREARGAPRILDGRTIAIGTAAFRLAQVKWIGLAFDEQ